MLPEGSQCLLQGFMLSSGADSARPLHPQLGSVCSLLCAWMVCEQHIPEHLSLGTDK